MRKRGVNSASMACKKLIISEYKFAISVKKKAARRPPLAVRLHFTFDCLLPGYENILVSGNIAGRIQEADGELINPDDQEVDRSGCCKRLGREEG